MCGPETVWMQTSKEMAHCDCRLEHSAIVKSGSFFAVVVVVGELLDLG